MSWSLLDERVTHHDKDGRFCGMSSAATVTKDGERFKVVRQHRRIKSKSREEISVKRHPRRVKASVAEASARVHEKAPAAVARTRLSGWASVREVLCGG